MIRKVNEENVITEFEKTNRECFGKYNKAFVIGEVIDEFKEVMSKDGKRKFYNTKIRVERQSGKNDIVQITVPKKLKKYDNYIGKVVRITGQFRSYIRNDHKRLFLYASTFDIYDELIPEDSNLVYLEGYLTAQPYCKRTKKSNKKIAAFCLAVRRKDSAKKEDADYINCIAWEDNADFIKQIPPKEKVKMYGRMQSRKIAEHEVYSLTVRQFLE